MGLTWRIVLEPVMTPQQVIQVSKIVHTSDWEEESNIQYWSWNAESMFMKFISHMLIRQCLVKPKVIIGVEHRKSEEV